MSTADLNPTHSLPFPQRTEDLSASDALEVATSVPYEAVLPSTEPLPVAPSQRLRTQVARSLRRRWLLAGLVGLLGAWLSAAAVWTQFPAQHTAEVWLQLKRASHEADKDDFSAPPQNYFLKTPLLLEATLQQPEVDTLLKQHPQAKPLDWLEQRVSTDAPGVGIARVTVTSEAPDEPAILAEAIARTFLDEIDKKKKQQLTQTKEAYQRAQEALRAQRTALTALEKTQRVQDESERQQLRLENERQQLRLERNKTQTELDAVVAQEKTLLPASEAEIAAAIKSDPVVRECEKEVERLTAQLKEYQRISARGANDPALVKLAAQLDMAHNRLTDCRMAIAVMVESRAAKAREELQTRREALAKKLAGLDELESTAGSRIGKSITGDGDATKIQALRDDLDAKREASRRLAAELQLLEADAKSGPAVTRLGDTRQYPNVNRDRRWLATGLGAAAAFLLLVLCIGLIESHDRHVKSAGDLDGASGLTVLGTLPNLRTPPAATDATASDSSAEAVDVLRTLLLQRTGGGPCIILVTSAAVCEGKTLLASHLAASLARAWRNTLLVDGDLRRPGAHKLFNIAADHGLSDVLRGEAEVAEVIQPTTLSRLSLLPAGRADSHALQALAQQEGTAFLDALREQYEFIVVDAAAVLPVADTLLLSQRVDVVVLAVRCGTSRLPSVRAAQQRLQAMDAPFFGAVVLGA